MKGDPVKINRLSDEDIQKKINKLLDEYPVLKRIDPTEYDDCAHCASYQIGRQYGDEIWDAWDELQDLYYLLDK